MTPSKPGPNPLTYVRHFHLMEPDEIASRRVERTICARCGANPENGDCGHNCRSLSVMV